MRNKGIREKGGVCKVDKVINENAMRWYGHMKRTRWCEKGG